MTEPMLVDFLVFIGLMALLGTLGKITFMLINRRRAPAALADDRFAELNERLARLEQIAESTAVEIERIGEGQRFTTKLLSERAIEK